MLTGRCLATMGRRKARALGFQVRLMSNRTVEGHSRPEKVCGGLVLGSRRLPVAVCLGLLSHVLAKLGSRKSANRPSPGLETWLARCGVWLVRRESCAMALNELTPKPRVLPPLDRAPSDEAPAQGPLPRPPSGERKGSRPGRVCPFREMSRMSESLLRLLFV